MISAYTCTLNQLALYPYPPTPRGWSEVCLAHPPQLHLPNAETFRRLHTSQRCSAYACLHSLFGSFISRRLLLRFSLALLYAMLGTHRLPARRTGYRSGVM